MEPASAKHGPARGLVVRLLLFGVAMLFLRLAYVAIVSGGSCSVDDFCFFSSPSEGLIGGGGGRRAAGAAYVRVGDGAVPAAVRELWTSRAWREAVDFYAAAFQALVADGILSPASKVLCLGSTDGHEVLALKEIGVPDAIGVSSERSPPLVIAGDVLRLGFTNNSFDFVFVAGGVIEDSASRSAVAKEIARTLKPEGFLAIHMTAGGFLSSPRSLMGLFPSYRLFRSREIDVQDSQAIQEVILHKVDAGDILGHKGVGEEDNGNPSSVGKLVSKCSMPELKTSIVQSAEPLITEEPLKPWITLKKNIKNVKYLPSMTDISLKKRFIYIDVGARSYGSSIGSWFKKQYPKQNRTFEIYAIEADRAFHGEYSRKKGVKLLPYAAWVRNETLSFEVNHDPDQKTEVTGSRGMGRIRPAASSSGGSSSGDVHTIQGFDLAEWLKNTVSERDFVVMKMDVEGTEFDLVPRLYETGAICLIDELFLECHYNRWQRCCPGERSPKYQHTYGQCLELFTSLRESGVLVHQWW